MATKREVLEAAQRGEGCLGRARDDEPVFVLRAKDMFAAGTIGFWASRLSMMSGSNQSKTLEANKVIEQFQEWGARNGTKIPD